MNYKSLGAFLQEHAETILPEKGNLSPKTFSSAEEKDTIESINWVTYCKDWQSMLKAVLNNFCRDRWGDAFAVHILLFPGEGKRADELSVWVVPVQVGVATK